MKRRKSLNCYDLLMIFSSLMIAQVNASQASQVSNYAQIPSSFQISQKIHHHRQNLSPSSAHQIIHQAAAAVPPPTYTGHLDTDTVESSNLDEPGKPSGGSSGEAPEETGALNGAILDTSLDQSGENSANQQREELSGELTSNNNSNNDDEAADNSQEAPERNLFINQHNSQLQAMHDLFERRQLNNNQQLQASQELNPISIGLDPVSGFNLPPFPVPNHDGMPPPPKLGPLANADNLDTNLSPPMPFGLNPLPHLMGFQSAPQFDGPQRGDQSAHSNHHTAAASGDSDGPSLKVWPKIFRFTDGRINLSDFEKQKKIRLSNKNQHNGENHIESAPIMFDGRQLKRKSFLILHGGIFS